MITLSGYDLRKLGVAITVTPFQYEFTVDRGGSTIFQLMFLLALCPWTGLDPTRFGHVTDVEIAFSPGVRIQLLLEVVPTVGNDCRSDRILPGTAKTDRRAISRG